MVSRRIVQISQNVETMQEKINVEKSQQKLKKNIENKKMLWYP